MVMRRNLGILPVKFNDDVGVASGAGAFVPLVKPVANVGTSATPTASVTSTKPNTTLTVLPIANALPPAILKATGIATVPNLVAPGMVPKALIQALSPNAPVTSATTPTNPSTDSTLQSGFLQTAQQALSNIDPKKAIMVAGGVALIGGIIYLVTKKKSTT